MHVLTGEQMAHDGHADLFLAADAKFAAARLAHDISHGESRKVVVFEDSVAAVA